MRSSIRFPLPEIGGRGHAAAVWGKEITPPVQPLADPFYAASESSIGEVGQELLAL